MRGGKDQRNVPYKDDYVPGINFIAVRLKSVPLKFSKIKKTSGGHCAGNPTGLMYPSNKAALFTSLPSARAVY